MIVPSGMRATNCKRNVLYLEKNVSQLGGAEWLYDTVSLSTGALVPSSLTLTSCVILGN